MTTLHGREKSGYDEESSFSREMGTEGVSAMEGTDWKLEYARILERIHARIRPKDCDESVLSHHLPFLESLDAVDGSSVALFDLRTRSYRFLTSSFKFLGGYPRDEALAQGPDYFFRLLHPQDLPFVLETVTRSFRFLLALDSRELREYRLTFEFRIRAAAGGLVRLIQQIVVLEQDARGNPWLVLVANDRAPRSPAEDGLERRLENRRAGTWHIFPPGENRTEGGKLSPRETEVLGLVASGLASREIADRLFISLATVNNHRQRILEKLGTRSSAEAVRYAASLGLV